ncbi:MAG: hypothetical protein K1X71_19065 [Pirellulales bacterium]|nr:hypothetical protein [Pirellulales bacterium]
MLRRSVLATAASGALAAAIFGAVVWSRPTAAPYTEDSIAAAAREAFANDQPGSLLEQKAPPPGFPVSSIVGTPAGARWRKLPSFLGRSAVVYQLRRGPTRGDLFVVRLAASPRAPKIELSRVPVSPQPVSTAGMTSAVWREQGLLFALVVEGGDGEYRRFIAAHPVVAMLAPARQR